jgi:hypothetical protein
LNFARKAFVEMRNSRPKKPAAVLPAALESAIAESIKPAKLSSARAAALKARVMEAVAREACARKASAMPTTVKSGEGHWRPLAPGVDMQILFDDGITASWFARVRAGGRLPPHVHAGGPEECLVVSGSCFIDGVYLQAGDYQLAPEGSRHDDIWSEHGCLLFVRNPSFKAHAVCR